MATRWTENDCSIKTVIDSLCQNICKLHEGKSLDESEEFYFNVPWKVSREGEVGNRQLPLSYSAWFLIDRLHAWISWASDLSFLHLSVPLSPTPSLEVHFFLYSRNLRRARSGGGIASGCDLLYGGEGVPLQNKGHSGKLLWAGFRQTGSQDR